MFADLEFSQNLLNMSGVNSINWARIIAQSQYIIFIRTFRLKITKTVKFFSSHRKFWRCLCRLHFKKNGTSN